MSYFMVVAIANNVWHARSSATDNPKEAYTILSLHTDNMLLESDDPNRLAQMLKDLRAGRVVKGYQHQEACEYLARLGAVPHEEPYCFTLPRDRDEVRRWLQLTRQWYNTTPEER